MNKEKRVPEGNPAQRKAFFTPRNIAWLAILLALTVVLQIWGSAINIGGASLNLSLIPIVVAAILLGALAGAIMGFVCGVVILITVVMGLEPLSLLMFQDHPFITVTLIFVKTTAAGFVAGLIYKAFSHKKPYHISLPRSFFINRKSSSSVSTATTFSCPALSSGAVFLLRFIHTAFQPAFTAPAISSG